MTQIVMAPWHKQSFEQFQYELLPQLLAERLPLENYRVEEGSGSTYTTTISIAAPAGEVSVVYTGLPQPDEEGVFEIDGRGYVVLPYAEDEELEDAHLVCVGEQLLNFIGEHLGQAPEGLVWDEGLLRAWLPLDGWIREFFMTGGWDESIKRDVQKDVDGGKAVSSQSERGVVQDRDTLALLAPGLSGASGGTVQPVDGTNWLARKQQLRRLFVPRRRHLFMPGHFGRTCPFETPEGPNIARFLHIALGAEIREGRLVITDERPEAGLGLGAAMIPLLEHNNPRKLLMGANMMRQWITPPEREAALVQSGNEPQEAEFWCGRNLLTAFTSAGEDTFEEAILISATGARKLNYPHVLEPGDKLSDRHGTKGVVSRIVADEEMPQLEDGTRVELVYNMIKMPARLYLGPLYEALLGRIARAEGEPVIAVPYHGPKPDEIRERLVRTGLSENGQERLVWNGKQLERLCTVGWVYWGKLTHLAGEKLQVSVQGSKGQQQAALEFYALRSVEAYETMREHYNTRATTNAEAGKLLERASRGEIVQSGARTPQFGELVRRLAVVGIRVDVREDGLHFAEIEAGQEALQLVQAVEHPWLPGRVLKWVGRYEGLPEYEAVMKANERLSRVLSGNGAESMRERARKQLAMRVQSYLETLVNADMVRPRARVLFSGRAVATPGRGLRHDQVGIAEELAWTLFGPLVVCELVRSAQSGEERDLAQAREAVVQRSEEAGAVLDRVMERSWIIVNRAPSTSAHAFVAFHPVRDRSRVVRLPALACRLLQTDFDGDQVAVFLPLTQEGQREAGERLSIVAHLERSVGLLAELLPRAESMWGLAELSRSEEGWREMCELVGGEIGRSGGIVTLEDMRVAMERVYERDGAGRTLEVLERLIKLGFVTARETGISLSPLIGMDGEEILAQGERRDIQEEVLAASQEYDDGEVGTLLLAVKSGAVGEIGQIVELVSGGNVVEDVEGRRVVIEHGYRDGLRPEEMNALAVEARETFAEVLYEMEQESRACVSEGRSKGFGVVARAMRAKSPGIVFAHAAATGEVDPLREVESRLFVGLEV